MSISLENNNAKFYVEKWREVKRIWNKWYFEPDTQCLLTALCQYSAHQDLNDIGIFAFVLGPASSGKTDTIINPLSWLPNTHIINNINSNSFLSAYGDGTNGILKRLPTHNGKSNGFLLWPEFSSFLSMKYEERKLVQAQLRMLFDGDYKLERTNLRNPIEWRGKLSILAACTPNLEDHWATDSELGERFLYTKIPGNSSFDRMKAMGEKARTHLGFEKEKLNEMKKTLLDLVDPKSLSVINIPQSEVPIEVDELPIFIANARRHVVRATYGRREIIDVSDMEGTSRISKNFCSMVKGGMMLFRMPKVQRVLLVPAVRMALDSIPTKRRKILVFLTFNHQNWFDAKQLNEELGILFPSLYWTLDELVAIRLIEVKKTKEGKKWKLSEEYYKLIRSSEQFMRSLPKV